MEKLRKELKALNDKINSINEAYKLRLQEIDTLTEGSNYDEPEDPRVLERIKVLRKEVDNLLSDWSTLTKEYQIRYEPLAKEAAKSLIGKCFKDVHGVRYVYELDHYDQDRVTYIVKNKVLRSKDGFTLLTEGKYLANKLLARGIFCSKQITYDEFLDYLDEAKSILNKEVSKIQDLKDIICLKSR